MKTLFRMLVILVAASIIGGLMYVGVSALGSSATSFEESEGRPQLPEGAEFRPEHDEHENRGDGIDLPGGSVKALVLMSLAGGVYSAIVWAGKKAKRSASA